ncbi:MAG: hypothetical protein EVA73_04625 [Limisphaerales bacterium]|nr:MAG: hypothetical protein EVA73_04625 [Limisphaerales bacterium]
MVPILPRVSIRPILRESGLICTPSPPPGPRSPPPGPRSPPPGPRPPPGPPPPGPRPPPGPPPPGPRPPPGWAYRDIVKARIEM